MAQKAWSPGVMCMGRVLEHGLVEPFDRKW
jgi:hypothetical protein